MTTHAIAIERDRPYGLYAIGFGFFLVLFDTTALNVATNRPPRRNWTVLPATIGRTYNDENTLVMPPVK